MILTDELIEKARRAYIEADTVDCATTAQIQRVSIRAALAAILPDVVETVEKKPETCADARRAAYSAAVTECGHIADTHRTFVGSAEAAAKSIAEAIRSLVKEEIK